MNKASALLVVAAALLIAACSSTPPKPSAPAVTNVAGNWFLTTESQMGPQDSKMTLVQTGKDLKGVMVTNSPMGDVDLTGTVDGDAVKWEFSINAQGTELRINYAGTTDGNTMKGKTVFGTFGEGTFTAKRQ